MAAFVDPATGEPRVACCDDDEVRIYDPIAGGAALVVIDVDSPVRAGGLQRPGDGRAAFGFVEIYKDKQ